MGSWFKHRGFFFFGHGMSEYSKMAVGSRREFYFILLITGACNRSISLMFRFLICRVQS